MKLKELFLIMFCAFPLLSFAVEKKIEVDVASWRQLNKGRSISSVPVLTHDDNILFIYSDVPLENLQIQVKDDFGNVAYIDNVSVAAEQKYSFTVDTGSPGEYIIELICDRKFLSGCFHL